MSAALSVRRYKDKNYLAKTFIVSRIFCKSTHFFQNTLLLSAFSHPKQTDYFSVCVWTVPPVEVKRICGPS